jgi:hypothetical protein
MAYYRLYFISPRSGGIHRFEEVEAADDLDAVRLAGERLGQEPIGSGGDGGIRTLGRSNPPTAV